MFMSSRRSEESVGKWQFESLFTLKKIVFLSQMALSRTLSRIYRVSQKLPGLKGFMALAESGVKDV